MQRYEHGGNIYGDGSVRLDFSVNTNPLGLPETVKRALAADEAIYTRYPDPLCRRLREALARHHGLRPEQILCGNGAADMIFRLCAWRRARRALVAAPTFSEYERPLRLFGGELLEHRLDPEADFALTAAFAGAITDDTELVFLCNPNNPTGRLAEPGAVQAVLERCRETGALLLVDECFIEFTQASSLLPRLEEYPNLLILRAFTKLYAMAGLRLGYLLGRPELLEAIAPYGPEWSVSGPAQAAGLAALAAEPDWTAACRAATGEERRFMSRGLTELGLRVFPSDANFLLLRSEKPLSGALAARGLPVRDCSNFSGLDEHYIRIGLKNRADNRLLLATIGEVLHG